MASYLLFFLSQSLLDSNLGSFGYILMNEELLKCTIENGMIDLSYVQEQIEMNKRKVLLGRHPYIIVWQGNDGKWYTYLPDEKRRILKNGLRKMRLKI